jgi:hypothetical protein
MPTAISTTFGFIQVFFMLPPFLKNLVPNRLDANQHDGHFMPSWRARQAIFYSSANDPARNRSI